MIANSSGRPYSSFSQRALVVVCNALVECRRNCSPPACWTRTTRSRSTPRRPTSSSIPNLGLADVRDLWSADPLFYPARPPAHWLMVADVYGQVLVVPLAPSRAGNPRTCRPIAAIPRLTTSPLATWRTDEYAFYAEAANQVPIGAPRVAPRRP